MNATFPNKVPFEDSVFKYITDSPGDSVNIDVISKSMGIGLAAVIVAVNSLEAKGLITVEDESGAS